MEMTEPYQIVEYSSTAAALAELRSRYAAPFDVATAKGMALAKEARAEVRGYRTALETLRKEIKAPALERCRLIDDEAKRITAELLKIEEPIDQQIKAEEQRREAEKAAKARAETARIAAIAARISGIRNRVSAVANQPAAAIRAEWTQVQALELAAAAIQTALDQAQALELAPEEYQEFMPDAIEALHDTRQALRTALDARLAYDAEQARLKAEQDAAAARIKAEREELERLRTAEAARLAAEARMAEEARQAQEAALKAQREAQEAELRAKREEQERQEQEARQTRQAEEARLQAERDAMERQRADLDAQQRALAEQAKVAKLSRKGKTADPVADLKKAINASPETAKALDEAYQRGFKAGLTDAQRVA